MEIATDKLHNLEIPSPRYFIKNTLSGERLLPINDKEMDNIQWDQFLKTEFTYTDRECGEFVVQRQKKGTLQKGGRKSYRLTETGRKAAEYLISTLPVDGDGFVDVFQGRLLVSALMDRAKQHDRNVLQARFDSLLGRSLEMRLRELENIDAVESYQCSNSQWQKVIGELVKDERYKNTPVQLLRQMVRPWAIKAYRDSRQHLENRSSDQELLHECFEATGQLLARSISENRKINNINQRKSMMDLVSESAREGYAAVRDEQIIQKNASRLVRLFLVKPPAASDQDGKELWLAMSRTPGMIQQLEIPPGMIEAGSWTEWQNLASEFSVNEYHEKQIIFRHYLKKRLALLREEVDEDRRLHLSAMNARFDMECDILGITDQIGIHHLTSETELADKLLYIWGQKRNIDGIELEAMSNEMMLRNLTSEKWLTGDQRSKFDEKLDFYDSQHFKETRSHLDVISKIKLKVIELKLKRKINSLTDLREINSGWSRSVQEILENKLKEPEWIRKLKLFNALRAASIITGVGIGVVQSEAMHSLFQDYNLHQITDGLHHLMVDLKHRPQNSEGVISSEEQGPSISSADVPHEVMGSGFGDTGGDHEDHLFHNSIDPDRFPDEDFPHLAKEDILISEVNEADSGTVVPDQDFAITDEKNHNPDPVETLPTTTEGPVLDLTNFWDDKKYEFRAENGKATVSVSLFIGKDTPHNYLPLSPNGTSTLMWNSIEAITRFGEHTLHPGEWISFVDIIDFADKLKQTELKTAEHGDGFFGRGNGACNAGTTLGEGFGLSVKFPDGTQMPVFVARPGYISGHNTSHNPLYYQYSYHGPGIAVNLAPEGKIDFAVNPALPDDILVKLGMSYTDTDPEHPFSGWYKPNLTVDLENLPDGTEIVYQRTTANRNETLQQITGTNLFWSKQADSEFFNSQGELIDPSGWAPAEKLESSSEDPSGSSTALHAPVNEQDGDTHFDTVVGEHRQLDELRVPHEYVPDPKDMVYPQDFGILVSSEPAGEVQIHKDAVPYIQAFFHAVKDKYGYDLVLKSGYRTYEEQDRLHQLTPSAAASAGMSMHQTPFAVDIKWLRDGEEVNLPWKLLKECESYGLAHPMEWDWPHFVVIGAIDSHGIEKMHNAGIDPAQSEKVVNAILQEIVSGRSQPNAASSDLSSTLEQDTRKVSISFKTYHQSALVPKDQWSESFNPDGQASEARHNPDGTVFWIRNQEWLPVATSDLPSPITQISPEEYERILKWNSVDNPANSRYARTENYTFCNVAAADWARAYQFNGVSAPLPRWWNEYKVTSDFLYDWFRTDIAQDLGWKMIDSRQAQDFANQGYLTFGVVNNDTGPGHIAAVAPGSGRTVNNEFYPTTVQAGGRNWGVKAGLTAWDSFQKYEKEPAYYVWIPPLDEVVLNSNPDLTRGN